MAALIFLIIIVLIPSITTSSYRINHIQRLFFNSHTTTTTQAPSFGTSFNKWISQLFSGDSNKETDYNSFDKLTLLKKILLTMSSSTNENSSKLDKLFQLLTNSALDNKNQITSSSSKLNQLIGFFNNYGSTLSNNFQLAMKLINFAQGATSLSSFSLNDIALLLKITNG